MRHNVCELESLDVTNPVSLDSNPRGGSIWDSWEFSMIILLQSLPTHVAQLCFPFSEKRGLDSHFVPTGYRQAAHKSYLTVAIEDTF